jgi:uncharacterized protein (TIGR00369 family)
MFDVATEPAIGAFLDPSLLGLSGLELLRTYLVGPDRWAPIAHLTGMHLTHVEPGRATSVMPLSDWLCAAPGTISPAALIVPTDSALGSAIHTTLPPKTLYTTAELSMTWVRPVAPGGQVTATGECVYTSPTLALSTARVTDDDGTLVAFATSRCTVFPPLPDVPAAAEAVAAVDAPHVPDPYERPLDAPVPPVDLARPGRARLEAVQRGTTPRPPVAQLFGLTLEEVGDGTATASAPCARWLCGPPGSLQGGVLAVVAHHAASAAAETTVAAGGELTALDLKVNLLRPVPPSAASLSARGTVTHRGRASTITAGTVTNPEGRPVALLTASWSAPPPG